MTAAEPFRCDPPLRNGLWNLLYRSVAATDHSRTAWTAVLRGAALVFFKVTIDDLPLGDNEASRAALKARFFDLPGHRVYDLFEFLLADDRAGLKETDRKLIRRGLNPLLGEANAPVRFLRDRFVPLQDELGLDAVAAAEEGLTLFDMPAAHRHLESAMAFLARRPEPACREAVREAVLAVAAAVRALARRSPRPGGPGPEEKPPGPGGGEVALGTVAPAAHLLGVPGDLLAGIEALLRRAHVLSGLPGAPLPDLPAAAGADVPSPESPPVMAEALFLVAFCGCVLRYLLSCAEEKGLAGE